MVRWTLEDLKNCKESEDAIEFKAAEQGNADAMCNLADHYLKGEGVAKNKEEAEAILEFAKRAEVLWTDDKDALPLACMEAQNYLNGGKILGEYILEAYHSIKEKGAKFLTKVSNKVSQ